MTDWYQLMLCSDARSIHKQWVDALITIRSITDPSVKAFWLEDLAALHRQARDLLQSDLSVNATDVGLLRHIAERPIKQHLAVISKTKTVL